MPLGSHRLKDAWTDARFDWMDDNGNFPDANWSQIESAKEEADLAEADYCSKEIRHCLDHHISIGGKMIFRI